MRFILIAFLLFICIFFFSFCSTPSGPMCLLLFPFFFLSFWHSWTYFYIEKKGHSKIETVPHLRNTLILFSFFLSWEGIILGKKKNNRKRTHSCRNSFYSFLSSKIRIKCYSSEQKKPNWRWAFHFPILGYHSWAIEKRHKQNTNAVHKNTFI